MPDSYGEGSQFAADLGELYEVATKGLRPLSNEYSRFSSKIEEATQYDLDQPPTGGAVSRGQSALQSGRALTSLRDDIQFAFARSCENVESAAVTLIEVANTYAAVDEETQSDFDAYLADNELAGPMMAPPKAPVYPDSRNQVRPQA
ncbi:hypothetical protein GALLR39Z86_09810 [Glycomyces algeriensis]|uniref:Uncharacterized protein n=2 Tax=Glycomyces algeriensis TaxID=256037 RepID=A0A9W6LG01_9ACTN|nr:hypothetical protein GALLR39Z86_09810 [Glycomyces algeriensis]